MAASYVFSGTLAPDVFSPQEHRHLVFGFVLGSTNGGDRGGSYLSPRQAQDLVVNARFRIGKTVIQGFLTDPNELPVADSRSRYVGLNLRYNDNKRLDASLTVAEATRSTTAYTVPDGRDLRREGLRVVNSRLKWNTAFGVPGLWIEGEVGREWHTDFDMAAHAVGAWAGYHFGSVRWRPAVLYRYSIFSGDDPSTTTYERFDPLLGGVQRDWLQGMVMVKMMNNANLEAHRVEVSVKPRTGMDVAVDFYKFRARELNNLGGSRPFQTLLSADLGYEVTPTLQWSVTPNIYVQALASFKAPGQGMTLALPQPARTWRTFQLSLYAGFSVHQRLPPNPASSTSSSAPTARSTSELQPTCPAARRHTTRATDRSTPQRVAPSASSTLKPTSRGLRLESARLNSSAGHTQRREP